MADPESYVVGAFDLEITARVVVRRVVTPGKPVIWGVTTSRFMRGKGMATARANTIKLSPADPAAQVTSRPCQVVFADGTPTVNVDMINPDATFPANDGQVVTITALGDINVVGQGPPSDPFHYTVAPPPPTVVPVKPTVEGVTSV